ncbi:MAG: hypothetical protein CL840_01335 [Crocinitomicaceae bacterium]|jgi:hypothetical protein|nr:hypothetical protein [Crocinitomicaceae bacterium]|tara:strand:+ start:192 stop:488 length:297 start_codon:yes stop_codon:yes gene_type:complete
MTHHILKTDPKLFEASFSGKRPWEIRKNDRNFQVGDSLTLKETQHTGQEMRDGAPLVYTGRELECEVEYIFEGQEAPFGVEHRGLSEDWVIMTVSHKQ